MIAEILRGIEWDWSNIITNEIKSEMLDPSPVPIGNVDSTNTFSPLDFQPVFSNRTLIDAIK